MTTISLREAAERLRNLNPYGGDDSLNFVRIAKDAVQVAEAYLAGQSQPVNEKLLAACEAALRIEDLWMPQHAGTTMMAEEAGVLARMKHGFTTAIDAAKTEQAARALPATEEWVRELVGKNNCGRLYAGSKWVPEIRGIEQWVRLPENATRGDVLDLLAILKVVKS